MRRLIVTIACLVLLVGCGREGDQRSGEPSPENKVQGVKPGPNPKPNPIKPGGRPLVGAEGDESRND